jgi:hypothetical protein
MKDELLRFLQDLDDYLVQIASPGEHLHLYQLGGSVLIMHYGLQRGTKDFDVVELHGDQLLQKALAWIGKETKLAREHNLYLDAVPAGLPPLPVGYERRCTAVDGPWKVLRLWCPDPHDFIVTKLKSFRIPDKQDIEYLCSRESIKPAILRERLEKAFLFTMEKDGDPIRDRAFTHLRQVIDYLEGRISHL